MSRKKKPERTDVCIVGGGASAGTAAKVLTQHGLKVVMLEKGPWLQKEDFSGDELANANRYYVWPDPDLNPRTWRFSEGEEARRENYCPLPQTVGGGTVHWDGHVLRMLPTDFLQRSLHGDIDGTSIVDWPITYWDLEPYYDRVEWALGVSGLAGANIYEGPRSRDYPCPPMPETRYAATFRKACERLGYNSFPTPLAQLSRRYSGRPASVQSAFAQQHGDPTGTRSNVLFTFIPEAYATGRLDLRPHSYVREITVDGAGRAKSALYEDADGDIVEQEADLFLLACAAIESARLLLLSRSSRFPDGLANSSGQVGCNLTLHEYTAAIGVFDEQHEPIYGWAGGGYVSASTFDFYVSDHRRGHIGGGHVAAHGVGIPLPINFSLPDKPAWGVAAKEWDRKYFNRSMAIGVIIYDMSQETNRVDLDDRVKDAWGLPVARITNRPHPNDLAQARWIVDRSGEILEAAGAEKVWPVYIDRITGNCAHQMGTCRMGNDPSRSVVDRYCRAHDVDNLYVIDGSVFPTSSGANPTLTIMANAWRVADHIIQERGIGA